MRLENLMHTDVDDELQSSVTACSSFTSAPFDDSVGSTITDRIEIDNLRWNDLIALHQTHHHQQHQRRRFRYHKRNRSVNGNCFNAPTGVNPYHVRSSSIQPHGTGNSRLIFIWPKKPSSSQNILLNILEPLMRVVIIGLLCLDAMHLWPGEFLPLTLPTTRSVPLKPIKCHVIEPRWFDNS